MISIEMPVLHGKYLSEVFESIRAQTFQDYKVIVVNSSSKGEISDLIRHYGDTRLSQIIKKYYRYGKTLKVLRGTTYNAFTKISRKRRRICKGNKFALYLLYLARGIPFLIGYYF